MCERFGFGCEYPVEPTLLTLDHSGTLIKQPTEERRQSIGIDDVHRKSQIMPATTHTRKDQAHKRGMAYPGGRRHHPDCKPEFWLEAEVSLLFKSTTSVQSILIAVSERRLIFKSPNLMSKGPNYRAKDSRRKTTLSTQKLITRHGNFHRQSLQTRI